MKTFIAVAVTVWVLLGLHYIAPVFAQMAQTLSQLGGL